MTKHKAKHLDPNEECCPKFHPEKWDEKTFQWEEKSFVKEAVPALFHIPFPPMIEKKIVKMTDLVEKANKTEANKEETLVLFSDPTPFKSEIYLSTTDNVPGANNAPLSGTFMAKVFDGSYNAVPKFIKFMKKYLAKKVPEKLMKNEDYFIHYAYCPRCQQKFHHNYMIIFAKVK